MMVSQAFSPQWGPFGSICTLSELQTCDGHSGLALYVFLIILLSTHSVCP